MKKILVASTNEQVIETVKLSCKKYATYFDADFYNDTDEALSSIDYELPEIKIIDFTSKEIDCHRIIATIDSDPWLHNNEYEDRLSKMLPDIAADVAPVRDVYDFYRFHDRLGEWWV